MWENPGGLPTTITVSKVRKGLSISAVVSAGQEKGVRVQNPTVDKPSF